MASPKWRYGPSFIEVGVALLVLLLVFDVYMFRVRESSCGTNPSSRPLGPGIAKFWAMTE